MMVDYAFGDYSGNPDYTFTNNGAAYSFKRLRVLVRQKP